MLESDNTAPVSRWVTLPLRILAVLIALVGLFLLIEGIRLALAGGSWYYLVVGLAYIVSGVQLWRRRISGAWLIGIVALLTVPWAIWERGFKFWALFPRLLMPMGFAAFALLLASPLVARVRKRIGPLCAGVAAGIVTLVLFGLAFVPHGVVSPAPGTAYQLPQAVDHASNWFAYGRTTMGTRFAPFNQINRDNVDQLEVAWTYHTGWDGKGANRLAVSDEYNSSIVALDVETGREVWHFQTVHHDIWDYDLPSQPALVDLPDGDGGTIPALLQTTKRGELFLLNRKTGKPITKVVEKPVPQDHVPGEYLSPTQPYSVGMPTIGAEHLTEEKMWGATMLDQLMCRIRFKQLRYAGDFTPIGLEPTLQQPGNLGGLNWGSVSYDPRNHNA